MREKHTVTVDLTVREISLAATSLLCFIGVLSQEASSAHREKLIDDCKELITKLLPEDTKKGSTA